MQFAVCYVDYGLICCTLRYIRRSERSEDPQTSKIKNRKSKNTKNNTTNNNKQAQTQQQPKHNKTQSLYL